MLEGIKKDSNLNQNTIATENRRNLKQGKY
jgi:hypothetical protein